MKSMIAAVCLFQLLFSASHAELSDFASNQTPLTTLPATMAFQIDKDVVLPGGLDSIIFQDAEVNHHAGDCVFSICRAAGEEKLLSFPITLVNGQRRVLPKLYGCEIRFRQKRSEPRAIRAGTRFVVERRNVEDVRAEGCETEEAGGPCQDSGTSESGYKFKNFSRIYTVRMVEFEVDSSSVKAIRCGSSEPSELTKGFMLRQFGDGNLQLLGPAIEEVQ